MKSGHALSAGHKPPRRGAVRDFFSLYLLGFLFAVALSPHMHLNDLDYLILEPVIRLPLSSFASSLTPKPQRFCRRRHARSEDELEHVFR